MDFTFIIIINSLVPSIYCSTQSFLYIYLKKGAPKKLHTSTCNLIIIIIIIKVLKCTKICKVTGNLKS